MTRLLCLLGLHRWGTWHRRNHMDGRTRVPTAFCYCLRNNCMAKQSKVL